jgi:hypothetical protein
MLSLISEDIQHKEVKMKKIFVLSLFAVVAAFQIPAQQNLIWDIQFQKGSYREIVPYSQTITKESGQELYAVISPASDCFCYVVSENSERKMVVLYEQIIKGGNEISLNPLQADNSLGTTTLYIIMSLVRQNKLEGFIKSYKDSPSLQRHANNLRGEIARLQDTVSGLGEPVIAVIASGGTTRGPSSNQDYVTQFSEKNIYVRAITIRTAPTVP